MPLRPFPVPLRIGTDICHLPRIKKLILSSNPTTTTSLDAAIKHRLDHFMRKFLSIREQKLFWQRHNTLDLTTPNAQTTSTSPAFDNATRYLAGRWAAKEAVIKAVSASRRTSFLDVQILPRLNGAGVYAVILDEPAAAAAIQQNDGGEGSQSSSAAANNDDGKIHGQVVEVSISHDGEYATATCIAPHLPRWGDVGGEAAAREP